jgi:hypothetical protein
MPVSLALKPEPVTLTQLPTTPLTGLMYIAGEVTVKVILGTLVVTEPYAPIVCEPGVDAKGTSKVALQPPRGLAVIPWATGVPSKVTVMPVSLPTKPEPVTVTKLPGTPLTGLMEIPGVAA